MTKNDVRIIAPDGTPRKGRNEGPLLSHPFGEHTCPIHCLGHGHTYGLDLLLELFNVLVPSKIAVETFDEVPALSCPVLQKIVDGGDLLPVLHGGGGPFPAEDVRHQPLPRQVPGDGRQVLAQEGRVHNHREINVLQDPGTRSHRNDSGDGIHHQGCEIVASVGQVIVFRVKIAVEHPFSQRQEHAAFRHPHFRRRVFRVHHPGDGSHHLGTRKISHGVTEGYQSVF